VRRFGFCVFSGAQSFVACEVKATRWQRGTVARVGLEAMVSQNIRYAMVVRPCFIVVLDSRNRGLKHGKGLMALTFISTT